MEKQEICRHCKHNIRQHDGRWYHSHSGNDVLTKYCNMRNPQICGCLIPEPLKSALKGGKGK